MTQVQLHNGSVLLVDGKVALDPDCCCGDYPPPVYLCCAENPPQAWSVVCSTVPDPADFDIAFLESVRDTVSGVPFVCTFQGQCGGNQYSYFRSPPVVIPVLYRGISLEWWCAVNVCELLFPGVLRITGRAGLRDAGDSPLNCEMPTTGAPYLEANQFQGLVGGPKDCVQNVVRTLLTDESWWLAGSSISVTPL